MKTTYTIIHQDDEGFVLKPQEKTLFDIDDFIIENNNYCGNCKHIQRWQCNSKFFHYCAIHKSNRTSNNLLKVKCKSKACNKFEE